MDSIGPAMVWLPCDPVKEVMASIDLSMQVKETDCLCKCALLGSSWNNVAFFSRFLESDTNENVLLWCALNSCLKQGLIDFAFKKNQPSYEGQRIIISVGF